MLASYKGVIAEDAATELSSQSLRLDTARYTLSANTRAFGLRVNAFRDRCTYEGGFDDELTLFVVDGRAIRPVLAETMSRWWHGPGNRCGGEETPRIDSNVTPEVVQRVRLGRAVALNPRLVVAEHPSAVLPRDTVTAFARDLARVVAGRKAALLSISADREFTKALGGLALTLDPKTGALSRPGLLARLGLG